MMRYIHQLDIWPKFVWDHEKIAALLGLVRNRQGRLMGRMEAMGFALRTEAMLQTLTLDVIKSSEIEGEVLDAQQVRSSIARRLGLDIAAIDHKDVVIFMVGEFPIKPVAVRGKYFKRVENSNHQLSPSEISNLHLQSLQLSWDSYPAHDATLDDLDVIKIERFISRVNAAGRFVLGGNWQESLEKLDLIRANKPANAAKLLFAKELKQYSIHVGRFKTPSMIIDDKMIKNTLYEAVEETIRFIISHLKVAFEFTG